jgi:hypothetical protein
VDYVAQLREGILEAYTGIVTGFKNTEKGDTSLLSGSYMTDFSTYQLEFYLIMPNTYSKLFRNA